MRASEDLKATIAFVAQRKIDLAPVVRVCMALKQTEFLAPVRQRDDTVVLGLKPLRKSAYGCQFAFGEPFDLKQELVLKRRQSAAPCQLLAIP